MGKYQPTEAVETQVTKAFTYHAPHSDQSQRYVGLRELARTLAVEFVTCCPQSRELSLALTKLEEAVMWANSSIARNEPQPEGG